MRRKPLSSTSVATYGSAVEAMYALQTSPVDILFLDIQMPDLTGLDFARMIPSSIHVVFTTAFREFAIDGYKVGAIDYLLKPIAYTDFLSAAQRVLTVVGRQAAKEVVCKPKTVTDNLPAEDGNIDAALPVEDGMFFVKSDYKYVRVSCQDILYIEGLKDYVKMHLASSQRAVVSLVSMRTLENTLPSTSFLRIHRSYIVNMKRASAWWTEIVSPSPTSCFPSQTPIKTLCRNTCQNMLYKDVDRQ